MGVPLLRPVPGTGLWATAYDWSFDWRGRTHVIPRGFNYDGASIPWLFRRWIGGKFEPAFMAAALLHDWMYRTQAVSRRSADQAFLAALKLSGVNAVRRRLMYWAVRVGGSNAYNGPRAKPKHRPDSLTRW